MSKELKIFNSINRRKFEYFGRMVKLIDITTTNPPQEQIDGRFDRKMNLG